jgi:hypothetical protein
LSQMLRWERTWRPSSAASACARLLLSRRGKAADRDLELEMHGHPEAVEDHVRPAGSIGTSCPLSRGGEGSLNPSLAGEQPGSRRQLRPALPSPTSSSCLRIGCLSLHQTPGNASLLMPIRSGDPIATGSFMSRATIRTSSSMSRERASELRLRALSCYPADLPGDLRSSPHRGGTA